MAVSIPVVSLTSANHCRPVSPQPSKQPGRVRGFHNPALNIFIPALDSSLAQESVCSLLSALHGPAITTGLPSVAGTAGIIPSNSSRRQVSLSCMSPWVSTVSFIVMQSYKKCPELWNPGHSLKLYCFGCLINSCG